MKACRKIRPLLEWLAANELNDSRRQLAEAHLRNCPACRRELNVWRSLLAAASLPAAAAEAEIRGIDWDAVSGKIMACVEGQPAPPPAASGAISVPLPGRRGGPDRGDRSGGVFLDPLQQRPTAAATGRSACPPAP